ncbi:MAG: MoaD/ThiS family protein [Actinobacteria bacterium]|nr:MoaD/ThiS family protein [Actinomycetota bacterium]
MATVKLHTLLVKQTGIRDYRSSAGTVSELLDELKEKHGDSIERYLKNCIVIVDGRKYEGEKGMRKKIKPGSEVSIFPRVAGG